MAVTTKVPQNNSPMIQTEGLESPKSILQSPMPSVFAPQLRPTLRFPAIATLCVASHCLILLISCVANTGNTRLASPRESAGGAVLVLPLSPLGKPDSGANYPKQHTLVLFFLVVRAQDGHLVDFFALSLPTHM